MFSSLLSAKRKPLNGDVYIEYIQIELNIIKKKFKSFEYWTKKNEKKNQRKKKGDGNTSLCMTGEWIGRETGLHKGDEREP